MESPIEAESEVAPEVAPVAELAPEESTSPAAATPVALMASGLPDPANERETAIASDAEPAGAFEEGDSSGILSRAAATFALDSLTLQLEAERRRLTGTLAMRQAGGEPAEIVQASPRYSISFRPQGGEWTPVEAGCASDTELVLVVGERGVGQGTINFSCDLAVPVPDPAEVRLYR